VDAQELRAVVAENIRRAAAERGSALDALADFAGVSRAQVYAVLAATTSPTLDWLAKVATALDVEVWRLLAPSLGRPSVRTRWCRRTAGAPQPGLP
jgi:DNA-binding phage protein